MSSPKDLRKHGQAVWLDFLARGFIAKGDLKRLIETDWVSGVTSNPAIFEKAIAGSSEYDEALSALIKERDRPIGELYEALAVQDILVLVGHHHAARWASPFIGENARW